MVADTAADRGFGYWAFHYLLILVVTAAILLVAAAVGTGISARFCPDERVSSVQRVADGSQVSGASSTLMRSDSGVDFTLRSSRLPTETW